MTTWKHSVNATLIRTIGYQLQRAQTADFAQSIQTSEASAAVARLEAVAQRLEHVSPAQAEQNDAGRQPAETGFAQTEFAQTEFAQTEFAQTEFPDDYDEEQREIIRAVQPYTRSSPDKLHGLITATRYLHRHDLPGAVVDCGVWRGGSMHAVARTLDALGDHSRDLFLFDTFEDAALQDVRQGFQRVPYPAERVHHVPGKVEDTVPEQAPGAIALLRLDTGSYESTRHDLAHLYPRLVPGGVLVVDDFGWWQGSRQATEEFLADTGARLLLVRTGTGRIAIKPWPS